MPTVALWRDELDTGPSMPWQQLVNEGTDQLIDTRL